jgi:lactate dehydrogenase-like 2-hydroxyacid dehydrogenase
VASKTRGLATFNHAPTALIDALPALEIIANCSVGNDGIDLATAGRRGIVVTNTPDVLNDCVAETAMALALNLLHRYPQAEQWLRQGRWPSGPFQLASELNRRTMGILGFGRIGAAIAQRAVAFGMNVRYHNRQRKETSYEYDASPIELATNSSVLMITVPGGNATRGLVNSAVLDALGPNGYLVNISRGSVIDEPALIAALRNKRIAGAALDVFDNEPNINPAFLELDNVVLTPHVGSASWETRTAMGNLQVENLRRYFSGEAVLTPVR